MHAECFNATSSNSFACKTRDAVNFECFCGFHDKDDFENEKNDNQIQLHQNDSTWYMKHLQDDHGVKSYFSIHGDGYDGTKSLKQLFEHDCKPNNYFLVCRSRRNTQQNPLRCYCIDDDNNVRPDPSGHLFQTESAVWSDAILEITETTTYSLIGGDNNTNPTKYSKFAF